MPDKLLTPDDVAQMLDLTPATIRLLLRNGALKGFKLGGGKLWRIGENAIREFVYENPWVDAKYEFRREIEG